MSKINQPQESFDSKIQDEIRKFVAQAIALGYKKKPTRPPQSTNPLEREVFTIDQFRQGEGHPKLVNLDPTSDSYEVEHHFVSQGGSILGVRYSEASQRHKYVIALSLAELPFSVSLLLKEDGNLHLAIRPYFQLVKPDGELMFSIATGLINWTPATQSPISIIYNGKYLPEVGELGGIKPSINLYKALMPSVNEWGRGIALDGTIHAERGGPFVSLPRTLDGITYDLSSGNGEASLRMTDTTGTRELTFPTAFSWKQLRALEDLLESDLGPVHLTSFRLPNGSANVPGPSLLRYSGPF